MPSDDHNPVSVSDTKVRSDAAPGLVAAVTMEAVAIDYSRQVEPAKKNAKN